MDEQFVIAHSSQTRLPQRRLIGEVSNEHDEFVYINIEKIYNKYTENEFDE